MSSNKSFSNSLNAKKESFSNSLNAKKENIGNFFETYPVRIMFVIIGIILLGLYFLLRNYGKKMGGWAIFIIIPGFIFAIIEFITFFMILDGKK
jgi:hypothetical protein